VLQGRVAVVTGGAAGIGFALAEGLARRGAAVLIADLKGCTSNLSATAEVLLTAYVAVQKQARAAREDQAALAVQGWNNLHDKVGSFADEHSTL
jgi:antitoxin CcdA